MHKKKLQQKFSYDNSSDDFEDNEISNQERNDALQNQKQVKLNRLDQYQNQEQNIICKRFPHSKFCACHYINSENQIFQVLDNLFICNFQTGLNTKLLLSYGITHILNITSQYYTPRTKYFKYLTIDIQRDNEEDIKKNFRITNRFINESIKEGGRVTIHGLNANNVSVSFGLAYMINNKKYSLKSGLQMLSSKMKIEISVNFMRQLQTYDLEKLAFVVVRKKED